MNPALCQLENSLLLIIDIQDKLAAAMPEKVINRVVKNTLLLTSSAAELAVPIVITQQYPKGLGGLLPAIQQALPKEAAVVEKTAFSCWQADACVGALQQHNRKQIILCGMEAHICVLQTAFDLHDAGYQPFVVEDAVCSRRLENYASGLSRMRQAGKNITNTESVVFEWLRDARHPQFKTLSALLR